MSVTRRLVCSLTLVLGVTVALGGCRHQGLNAWEKGRLEAQAVDDLESAVAELGGMSASIDDAATARGSISVDRAGYAGCTHHYLYDGTVAVGTVEMELQGVPCAASLTLNDVRYEYTISEWSWSGSWESVDETWWDVEWSGTSASALEVEGSENYDGVYDASFAMNAASARTDGAGTLAFWSIDYSYAGFLDREWDVIVAKDEAGVVTGSIVSADGITCTVSGQDYDYVVDCD